MQFVDMAAPASERSIWLDRTALLVAASALLRWIVAAATGLSDTEAYYAGWARFPSLSYYDHPPLIAWTTWLVARAGGSLGDAATVRLGPVLYAAAFGALLYRLAARLFSPRAGFYAVALVTATPVFFFVGFLLNPEALLAPLWTLFLLLLLDLRDRDEAWRPLALGGVVGVAFLAKYTAVLMVPVTLLYVAGWADTRRWLRRPSFYLGGLAALAIASPVVLWNAARGWPSLNLHLSERMGTAPHEGIVHAIGRVGGAQLLYFQPVLLPALVALLVYAGVRSRSDGRYRLLFVASAPVLAFLLTVMVRAGDSEPHWTMMGYLPLLVAGAGVMDEGTGGLRRGAHAVFVAAIASSAVAIVLYGVNVRTPALARALPRYDAAADPVNETVGWDNVRSAIRARAAALGPGAVALGAHNVLCGHLQAALDDSPPVYCAAPRRTEFDFVGRRSTPAGAPVIFVDSARYEADPAAALPGLSCVRAQEVPIDREGLHVGEYRLYDCTPRGDAVRPTSAVP